VFESQKATVVLVHGAGGGAWCWEPLGKELDERGVAHVEVDLPTMAVDGNPILGFHDDAAQRLTGSKGRWWSAVTPMEGW
jgi:thioesterase domain-containing protein